MRGALSNPAGRFESRRFESEDDGWGILEEPLPPLEARVLPEPARSVITRNDSPDVPFEQSINPYRRCVHGCVYCFARPALAYVYLSPGADVVRFRHAGVIRVERQGGAWAILWAVVPELVTENM